METPQKVNHEIADFLWGVAEFIIRNLFGVLSALAGIAYQIYQMSGRAKRMTKVQCIVSVFMWFVASLAIVIGLEGVGINKLFYGLICWATPIIVKPVADTLSVKASPFTEKVIKSFEKILEGWTNRNKNA
jgi:hypothetical protein